MAATHTLILAFVAILIGVVLVGPVTTQTALSTQTLGINNEIVNMIPLRLAGNSINTTATTALANKPTGWLAASDGPTECQPGSGVNTYTIKNASGTALTLTTDYTVATLGDITFKNTSATVYNSNTTLVSYTYCPTSYLSNSWSRSVLNFVGGFFAIAIMGVGVGLFYSIGREVGII